MFNSSPKAAAAPQLQALGGMDTAAVERTDLPAYEKERIELLRELKRVLTLVLEQQHDQSTELSEEDPVVNELLVWVERCLWHGLRRSLLKGDKFEKETRISLWTVIANSKLSPPATVASEEDVADAAQLEQVKREVFEMFEVRTDAGKSRAWVRLALNRGVLGSIAWLRDLDARTFYEPLSIWRSAEQRSIAVSLLSSLKGLRFNLKPTMPKFDIDPEPSRRPHFLGISSMRATNTAGTAISSPSHPIIESAESRARQERAIKEREAIEALKGKTAHNPQPQQNSFTSWVMGALSWASGPETAPAKQAPEVAPKRKPKKIPTFLGSTLTDLVLDPRTCPDALLEWRIGVPKAISALLLLIDVEEGSDPFDPRNVSEEDNPKFVVEVGSLIRRLSDRESEITSSSQWDGMPHLVAAAALKLFFRQLPEPIIPYDAYDALVACQKIGDANARTRNIKFLIDSIPDAHKPTLFALIDVVGRKCDAEVTNSISAANALAPALLRPRPGPEGGLGRASEAAELVAIMIERRDDIFADISKDIHNLRAKLERKLMRIEQVYLNSRRSVEWPGTTDEEWMKRAWVALAPTEAEAEKGLEGFSPVSDEWIRRGFRTGYMTHDFRGCGFSALEHIVYLGERYGDFTKRMLTKHQTYVTPPVNDTERAQRNIEEEKLTVEERIKRDENKSKFPFVLGAAQLSRAVVEMIGIDPRSTNFNAKHLAELSTWPLLDEDDAIEHIFALAMRLLDFEWTRQRAKAMDFTRLKREVILRIAELIDSKRPQTVNELRMMLTKDAPAINDLTPQPSLTKKTTAATDPRDQALDGEKKDQQDEEEAPKKTPIAAELSGNQKALAPHNDLLPRLVCPFSNIESTILNQTHVAPLESALPSEYRGYDWELIFSTQAQGFNLDAFFASASNHVATVLVVSDVETESVFGAFSAEQWAHRGDEYYGTGQSFLFSFSGGYFQDFHWTRANSFFMISNDDCLAVGQGQGGFGIYIDGDLRQGTTSACSTFGNDRPLIVAESDQHKEFDGTNFEFTCKAIELWCFIPKTVSKRRTSSVSSLQ